MDKATMSWKWQQWLPTLSPWFAKVLMRMMSYRPNNRYQSAREVDLALRSVADLVGNTASGFLTENSPTTTTTGSQPTSGYAAASQSRPSNKRYTSYTPKYKQRNELWTHPLVLIVTGGVVILIPFMLFKNFMPGEIKIKPLPTPTTTPSVASSPSPATVPSSEPPSVPVQPSAQVSTELVALTPGQPALIKENYLTANQIVSYQLSGLLPTQQLTVKIEGNAHLSVLAPNKVPVDFKAQKVSSWQGTVPTAGDYYVEVMLPQGTTSGNFRLSLAASSSAATAIGTPSSGSPPRSNFLSSPMPSLVSP
jgi:serine/threonine-protein kinase